MARELIYIAEASGFGGAENYLLALVKAQLVRQRPLKVALPFRPANRELRERLTVLGATVINLPQYRVNYPLNLLIGLVFFWRHRKASFHFSLPYVDSCRWLQLAAALLGCSYVMTEHQIPSDPLQSGWYLAITYRLMNGLKKYFYRRSVQALTVSDYVRSVLVNVYGMPVGKISVVHNGIDEEAAQANLMPRQELRRELLLPEQAVVVTVVCRLIKMKGVQFLVSVLELLADRTPDLYLLIVGDGPFRKELEAQAGRGAAADRLVFTGFRKDIPSLLAASDLFVLPSLEEGFPLSILEAMAAGLPVVVTDAGGSQEAVVEGETGLVVPAGQVEPLALALELLVVDKVMRLRMGKAGRQLLVKRFTEGRMLTETGSWYSML